MGLNLGQLQSTRWTVLALPCFYWWNTSFDKEEGGPASSPRLISRPRSHDGAHASQVLAWTQVLTPQLQHNCLLHSSQTLPPC